MIQAVIPRHGAPDVFRIEEVPDKPPATEEVRIAVRASGVNFADVMARLGLYPDAPPLPMVVGYEVAGVIDAVGPGVDRFRQGDRVLALTRFGGYATSVVVPAAYTFPTPSGLDDVEAAAIPVNYLTAAVALHRLANVAANDVVLIFGAAGGVGVAATQLARLRNAVVIGTASRSKLDAIRSIGVDHPLDRESPDLGAEVRRLTANRGADIILDSIGGRSFSRSYRLLAPLGRLVLMGVSSLATGERRNLLRTLGTLLAMPSFRPLSLMNHNRAVLGLNLGHLWGEVAPLRAAMVELLDHFSAGRLRPVVARTFPLEDVAEAHRYLQGRANVGKVVLRYHRST